MKIALVHDAIFCRAGGERVLINFHKAFPDAPIYTSIYDADSTYQEFKKCDIRTTWLQKIAGTEKKYKYSFFPLGVLAMKFLDLTDFDVLLITTTHSAKYIKTSPNALVIAYCFTPFRLAWNPISYNLYEKSEGLKRFALNMIIKYLRKIDFKYAQRPDYYLAMTKETKQRIRRAYNVKDEIKVINPSINVSKYQIDQEISEYYLVVSRLEKYKKVDLAIEAFNKLKKKLIVVGRGIEKENLKRIAGPTIEFYEGLEDYELAKIYSKCKAFVFPQHEDYGLTPLEANASGRPVIAYSKGGVNETMIPYKGDSKKCTALFFHQQTSEEIINAIKKTETLEFDPIFIRNHAKNFDDKKFCQRIRKIVLEKYTEHIQTTKTKKITT